MIEETAVSVLEKTKEEGGSFGHQMPIRDIIDRFEILTEKDVKITLIRRSYNDKDLNSIFKICKLLGQDDIAKLLLDNNRRSLYRLLSAVTNSHLVTALKKLEDLEISFHHDSMSRGQIKSKVWLKKTLETLSVELGTVFLCAGWYGTLATILFESNLKITKIRSFDVDPECEHVADIFNKPWVIDNWKFKSSTKDILHINYELDHYQVQNSRGEIEILSDSPDTIINTSCEHIDGFDVWYEKIPKGKLCVLQTNNYLDIPDHVNCSTDLEEFQKQTPMTECLYEGQLDLDHYSRFMRIGYK
jgi:hypothetical protein